MDSSWKPLSKVGLAVAVISAIAFWIHALADDDGFLLMDYINLPFHEFGHLLLAPIGEMTGILGGTIVQLAIPIVVLVSFWLRREAAGVAFGAFWFGESLLYSSVYIADARAMLLPLVGGGEHDWNTILSEMNMLQYDTAIAGIVKVIGWLIMASALVWLLIISLTRQGEDYEP